MNESPDHDVEVFTEALKLAAGQRAAYLDRACGDDADLRRKVEALLKGHDEVGDFLEHSPHETTAQGKPGPPIGEKPGDRVGRYKLLQQIGEGGCGVVFMAEQDEPVRRRVALKIIKPGMDTKSVIARFEAERQALAMMNHPNIAKIFDAGATESRRPYFVMELVRGVKITEYSDQHSLTTEERLKLFVQVCQAIQHAHQKGVIHRDIKPSNILVTTTAEGVRLPVVIDFGIAKATTTEQLTDKTLFTAFEMLIGTPAYMSPEQAELSSADIDTRTDIYSLGVLLYELLTGSTPLDTGELLKAGLDKIRQVIREREPARPSTRLSKMTVSDLRPVAQHRKSEPPALIHAIRGDLDWITMKALEKDRIRRYETAYGLALDIERYLADEPVVARPAGTMYRVRKLIRRNKLAFAAGVAIVAMLVLGLAASLWQAARANREAKAERAAREDAEAILNFITDVLQSPDPGLDGRTITVADSLGRAAEKLETDLTNQTDRQARLQETIASTFYALGLANNAIPLQEKVRDYYLKSLGLDQTKTLKNLANLAKSYYAAGRRDEALKLRGEVLRLRQKVIGPEHPETLWAMTELALSYEDAGREDDAIKLREEALTISRKVNGPEHPFTLTAMNELANSYFTAGRRDEALKLREEVLALRRKVSGPEHPDTLMAMSTLALSYADAGRKGEATKLQEEVLTLRRKVSGPEHPDTLMAMTDLALSYADAGRKDEAIKLQEEVLTLSQKVSGPEHPDTLLAMDNLATVYFAAGRKDEAVKLREEVLALSLRQDPNSPASANAYAGLGFTLDKVGRGQEAIKAWQEAVRINPSETHDTAYSLGKALVDRQRYAEALPILRATQKFYLDGDRGRETSDRLALVEAMVAGQDAKPGASDRVLAVLRQMVAANPTNTDKAKQLATVYLWLGQTNEHEAICRKLLDLAANSKDASSHDRAAKAYLIQAHPDPETLKQAVASGLQALQLAATNDGNRSGFLVTAGMAAVRDGKPAEAEPLLNEALKVAGDDPNLRSLALAYRTLARAHLGRIEEARADFADLEKMAPGLPAPPAPSAILLQPDVLAVCLAHAEAKSLLNVSPPPAKP